jgi:Ubiquitin carboxyl-terminal hydrolase
MAPYTTYVVGNKAVTKGKGSKSGHAPGSDHRFAYVILTRLISRCFLHGHFNRYPGPEALYEYELFAVICHEGQIDNGHYTNFARFQDEVGVSV